MFDVGAVWTSDSGKYTVGLHGRNLGDEEYIAAAYDFPTVVNSVIGFYGPPQTVTLTGSVHFR